MDTMHDDLRPIGSGRFAFSMNTPWGQRIPAELLVTTRRGWANRPESRDERWTAYAVGPAVMAIRLLDGLPRGSSRGARPSPLALPPFVTTRSIPAEWN